MWYIFEKQKEMEVRFMDCPVCGAPIIEGNHYRCSRFPVCGFEVSIHDENIFDPGSDTFIVFDLETTGLNRREDRIIEIGAVKVVDGEAVSTFDVLINPGRKENGVKISIPSKVVSLTGITNEMVADRASEEEGLKSFFDWMGDIQFVVGHNIAAFDIPFVKSACRRNAIDCPFEKQVDTLKYAKTLNLVKTGVIENNKQETLAKHVNFSYNAHRANEDTQALLEILNRLVDKYEVLPFIEKV